MVNRNSPSGPRISWQGTTVSFADLPLAGNKPGDVRVTTSTDELWIWNGVAWTPPSGLGTDERVKVSAADTTPGFLTSKLAAGLGAIFTLLNAGANEQLQIDAPGLAFANPAALAAFDATLTPEFAMAGVGVVNDSYQLSRTPSATVLAAADGVNIVLAALPAGAVWLRKYDQNLPAQYEPAWFLDAAAGSDANAGTTALAPLRTMHELSVRLRDARIAQNVTVTLAAGNYSADPVRFDLEVEQGFSVLVTGAITSTTDTIAAILPTVPGAAATNAGAQRGTLTATALNFAATDDRRRLRLTDGASVGAMAFITRVVTPGVGGVVNTTRWGRLTNPLTSTIVTNVSPTVGTGFAIDTLDSRIGYMDVRVRGPGRFVVTDCLIRPSETVSVSNRCLSDNGNGNGVLTYGCIYQSASSLLMQGGGGWTQAVCSLSSDIGVVVYTGVTIIPVRMCVFTGTATTPSATLFVQNGTTVQQNEAVCFDRCQLILQTGAFWDQIGQANNDAQHVDGTAAHAMEVAQTGTYWAHSSTNLQWGLDNAFTAATYLITGRHFYNPTPSVPGNATDWTVGSLTGIWAALPTFDTVPPGAAAVMTN